MKLTIISCEAPHYTDERRDAIWCATVWAEQPGRHPFIASPHDREEHGAALYGDLVAGKFGPIGEPPADGSMFSISSPIRTVEVNRHRFTVRVEHGVHLYSWKPRYGRDGQPVDLDDRDSNPRLCSMQEIAACHDEIAASEEKPQKMPNLVAVMGIQRSGTSAVAGTLADLNIPFGDDLLGPDPAINPLGFYEDLAVTALNEEALAALHAIWDQVGIIGPDQLRTLDQLGLIPRARALIKSRIAEYGSWGFKDPRCTKLLPMWRAAIQAAAIHDQEFSPAFVITLRNPASVVESLIALRPTVATPERGARYWTEYMLNCLRYTGGYPRIVVDYDLLVDDTASEQERIAKFLGVPDTGRFFIKASLRKMHDTDVASFPRVTQEIFAALMACARDERSIDDIPAAQINGWWSEFIQTVPADLRPKATP